MDEKELLKELEVYEKKYGERHKVKHFFSFLAENGRDSFYKTLEKGHITASGWLISEDVKKVLLVSHKKLKKLIQPGGHCEKDDSSIKMAALRELREETGLQNIKLVNKEIFYIDIHKVDYGNKMHLHYDICYLFICNDKQQVIVSEELDGIKWYELERLKYMKEMDMAVIKMAGRVKEIWSDF